MAEQNREKLISLDNVCKYFNVGRGKTLKAVDGITLDTVKGLLDVDKGLWMEDANGVEALYDEIGARVPAELRKQLADLKARLA